VWIGGTEQTEEKIIKERRARKRYVTGIKLCVFCNNLIEHHHHSLGDEV